VEPDALEAGMPSRLLHKAVFERNPFPLFWSWVASDYSLIRFKPGFYLQTSRYLSARFTPDFSTGGANLRNGGSNTSEYTLYEHAIKIVKQITLEGAILTKHVGVQKRDAFYKQCTVPLSSTAFKKAHGFPMKNWGATRFFKGWERW
jgi:hypothetical protein